MTALSTEALTKLHHSVLSPVSVAVVKTRARHPASELNTKKAESWPVLRLDQILAICGTLLDKESGIEAAKRYRRVSMGTSSSEKSRKPDAPAAARKPRILPALPEVREYAMTSRLR